MKKFILLTLMFVSVYIFADEIKEVRIGVLYDGKSSKTDFISQNIKKELQNIVGADYKIIFPKEKQIVDNFNKEDIDRNLDLLLKDEDIDIIIAGGVLSSISVMSREGFSKPVFAPFIYLDLERTGFKKIKNRSYLKSDINLKEEFDMLEKISAFSNVKILVGEEFTDAIPDIFSRFERKMKENNIDFEYEFIKVGQNLNDVYMQLDGAEAVSIGPINTISDMKKSELYDYIIKKKIPSFSILGTVDVKEGLLAGLSYEKDSKKRIRTLAINISRYLAGEKIEDFANVVGESKSELVLNMEVVEKTNIWPDWDIISNAKLVNFMSYDAEDAMNLKEVVEIALKNSPKLNAIREDIKNADLDKKNAFGLYKPHIDFGVYGTEMDKTRAKSYTVPYAQRTMDAEINLTQVIFNDDINLGKKVSKEYTKISEEQLKKAEKELILDVSKAYFNTLKIEAYAKIQRNKLELTKENLNIAKSRKAAGISGAADIYRWESELANSVSSLIDSMIKVSLAKTNLKRIINYDLKDNIEIKEMSHSNSLFITSNDELLRYIDNKKDMSLLIDYLTSLAYENSSDLKNLENMIKIEKAIYANKKRKRYMPTVALKGTYRYDDLVKDGVGEDNPDPSKDMHEWNVTVAFELPLYSGGEIKNNAEKSENNINKYEYQRELLKKGIQQEVISNSSLLVSDFARIKNAYLSSEAAHKALDLVSDAYFKGVVSIAELMDAQNAVTSADVYKDTVIYDFLISVMKTEKSVGAFFFMLDKEEQKSVLEDLKNL